MTGGRGRVSRGASSSNNITSDVKTRAAKALGVEAVSGVKCTNVHGLLRVTFQ